MTLKSDQVDWWRRAVLYQIYPRSFQDSDGDGVGDLKGIEARLDYLSALGVDALWISPFFKSPMKDFGYDVEDHRAVDPLFGNLDDFRSLLAAAHGRGIRILIDLVLSPPADAHPWFQAARAERGAPYEDCFVWAEPKEDGGPPNNWLSFFGGPAWTWEPRRGQYYLHNFLSSQPELNFHSDRVCQEVLDIARFWLDIGVDGFRLDTVNFYFHDQALRDNPPTSNRASQLVAQANPYGFQRHLYDKNQPEVLGFLEALGEVLADYPGSIALGEVGAERPWSDRLMRDYSMRGRLQLCYTFDLLSEAFTAEHFREVIGAGDPGDPPLWRCLAFSNHDVPRAASRFSPSEAPDDQVSALALALLLALPGTPCLYQGEELGLPEAVVSRDKLVDPYGIAFWPIFKGRDGCRTPMPWTHDDHGAFTAPEVTPWLPVPENHLSRCAEGQRRSSDSLFSLTHRLIRFRRETPALQGIEFTVCDGHDRDLLAFVRRHGQATLMCCFNLSPDVKTYVLDEPQAYSSVLGSAGSVVEGAELRLDPWAWAYLEGS